MLKFKNGELLPYGKFLQKVELKNKASRARSKLISKMDDKLKEYDKDKMVLVEKYGERDDEGNLIRDGDVYHWQKDKADEATAALTELNEEAVYLNIEEYRPNIEFLTNALNAIDMDLSGDDAVIYNELMDKLEAETTKKEEKEND